MTFQKTSGILCMFAIIFTHSATAQTTDIGALRAALNELRRDYEARISELEQRVAVAERTARDQLITTEINAAQATTIPVSKANQSRASNSAYNPAIALIFQGQAWHYRDGSLDNGVPGFPFGGEAGPLAEGLAIGEAEINISANIDDKFSAWLTAPLVIEDGEAAIEIEEAWIETTALPAGLSSRFGRFFSGIGYLNNKHAHSWDFADQPLPYQVFLGDQYLDDGVQLRWIAPTDLYLELGAEIFRGSRFPAAGSVHSGYGSDSAFINVGGDVGQNHSWLAGLSRLNSRARERAVGDEDQPLLFTGDTETSLAHVVWKWAQNGNWKQRNLVLQSGLFWNNDRGQIGLPDNTSALGYHNDQRGWYAQAVYQPFPRFRFGARFDGLSKDPTDPAFDGSALATPLRDPRRYSVMADWSNSEFSRLRLQYTRDETGPTDDEQWGLQYIFSIGAHGGHEF